MRAITPTFIGVAVSVSNWKVNYRELQKLKSWKSKCMDPCLLYLSISSFNSRQAKIRQLELDIAAAPKPERVEKYVISFIGGII